ncbi:EamA family transporter [Hahella ganghwensis]|uniref:EamA family transporter n=1 Tax=Hahella ganghwensis TaxID=286420 RepID=UPI0003623DDE|nr:EamA family transporter [Hahella ganghwensis]
MAVKHVIAALLVCVIWGTNFSVIKIGLEEMPPLFFSAMRFAAVALVAVWFFPFPRHQIRSLIGVGVILGIAKFSLLFGGMSLGVGAGVSSLLLQSQVFFTVILCLVVLREQVSPIQWGGIFAGACGLLLFAMDNGAAGTWTGSAMILLAAMCWATANLIMRRMGKVNQLGFMVWVCAIPPLPLLLLSYVFESPDLPAMFGQMSVSGWGSIFYVSFISTLLAYALWGKLLSQYAAIQVTPFALLIPLIGILVSSWWLGEVLTATQWVGALVTVLGLGLCVVRFGPAYQRILRLFGMKVVVRSNP